MSITTRTCIAALATLATFAPTRSVFAQQTPQAPAQQPVPKHHSKVKGALVGAAAGHAMGGHAKAGAVAGAVVQHHRNKKAAKAAAKTP